MQALGLAVAEDRLDGLGHLGPLAVARPRRGQLRPQLGQRRRRPLDPLVPRQRVEFGLAGAVIPDQAVPLGGGRLRLVDREAVDQLALVIELVVDRFASGPGPSRTVARKAASSPRVRGRTVRNRPPC